MMFNSIDEIREFSTAQGSYWFEQESMDTFGSVVYDPVYYGHYFISSEETWDGNDHLFTIRYCDDEGIIFTVGDFQEYATLESARDALTLSSEVRDEFEEWLNEET